MCKFTNIVTTVFLKIIVDCNRIYVGEFTGSLIKKGAFPVFLLNSLYYKCCVFDFKMHNYKKQ